MAGDPAADLGDLYAWPTPAGKLVLILTYGGALEAGASPVYDTDVLYTFNIDLGGDGTVDHAIRVIFGQNDFGDWGYRVENAPGLAPFEGAVGDVIDVGLNTRSWAGLADDPAFYDLEGWEDTLANLQANPDGPGNLAFVWNRDVFEGLNTMAIVLEVDLAETFGDQTLGIIWATSGRRS